MSEQEPKQSIWPVILVTVLVGYAFYAGVWVGIVALVVGVIALGWSRRHEGPLPTGKSKLDKH